MNVIAVDVGTTSVRLAIISFQGAQARDANVLSSHKKNIGHTQDGCRFEQSSQEIWSAICECSRECVAKSNIRPDSIKGIAFSATCSMVVVEDVNIDSNKNDVIMWMDHRAIEEAQKITATCSKVLNQFGGVCSPEFSLSKLVWLRDKEPHRFSSATSFFELPDWLVYRCIGGKPGACPRSLCCVTCKWGYDAKSGSHCDIISSLESSNFSRVGEFTLGPGSVAGLLNSTAALELGLINNSSRDKENFQPLKIVVGSSLIDAHAGMLAMLSVPLKPFGIEQKIEATFCSLAGTSSCHMLLSRDPNFKQGIWGPYKDVVIQGYHLLEAGQSLTGKLIEIIIESHEEGKTKLAKGEQMYDIIRGLNEQAVATAAATIGTDLHVLPTFHGNRSPLANPRLKGGIYGLTAEDSKSLLETYVATVEALAYETKLIVETLNTKLDAMLVSGGLMENVFYMQTLADVLRFKVVKMSLESVDFMVMGSGLIARHAVCSLDPNISAKGSEAMVGPLTGESIANINYPQLDIKMYEPRVERFAHHERKYLCYREFVEFSQRIDKIMHP